MPKFIDYYAALSVPKHASLEEIKTAYHKLALAYHPDHNPGDKTAEIKFQGINEAYAGLSTPQKRLIYDHLWENLKAGEEVVFSSGPQDSAQSAGFSDFFSALFRNIAYRAAKNYADHLKEQRAQSGPHSCSIDDYELHISLEEALRGFNQELNVCCQSVCPACAGTGEPQGAPCPQCGGMGVLVALKKAGITLPRGVRSWDRVSLSSSECFSAAGKRGEHYLKILIAPHPDFRMRGDDIETDLKVTARDADAAKEVTFSAADGLCKLKLPPNLVSGAKLRVPGRGLYRKDGTRGDLNVIVSISDDPVSFQKRPLF